MKGWMLFYVLLGFLGASWAEHKRWLRSTNWGDGANWDAGRPPCSKDRVRLPQDSAVFIQTNATITEIVLPVNGELILGSYMSFAAALPSKNEDNCQGQDIQYTRKEVFSWFDASNWCSSTDIGGGCKATQPALLDTELLPCSFDSVTFPENSAFLVNLGSGIDIVTGTMHFAGKTYTTREFRTLLQSKDGQQQFKRDQGPPTTVKINAEGCTDETGCTCGNDKGAIFDAICSKRKSPCPELSCHKTVQPIGSCCPSCGAVVQMSYDHRNFHYNSFKNKIYNRHLHDQNQVKAIFSKTSTDYIQIALADDGAGEEAAKVARKIREAIDQDSASTKEYGITKVDLYTSENVQPTAHGHTDNDGGMKGGSMVGIIVAILIIISLIALGLFCLLYRRQRDRPPMDIKKSITDTFSRIAHRMRSQDLEEGSRFQDKVIFSDLASFENPMFNQPGAEVSYQMQQRQHIQEIDPADPSVSGLAFASEPEPGFTNPLYGQDSHVEEFQHGGVKTSVLKLNPVFSSEGIEDDSTI